MKQILIYADSGVKKSCFEQTVNSLLETLDRDHYTVKPCDAAMLLSTGWEEQTVLLVFPGGRDLPYHQKLFPNGTKRIYRYVAQGGSYLGFCAGAYFGAREIEFERGGDLEVCGKRDLAFFPGRAIGPAFGNGKFRYDSENGIEAALIEWDGVRTPCHAYFNGGCYFETPDLFSDIHVLGRYADLPEKPAAAIACQVGKGKAVLSGVHLEYSVQNWEAVTPRAQNVRALLQDSEKERRNCLRWLLEQSGLTNFQKSSSMK